jgi:hypothetical protein
VPATQLIRARTMVRGLRRLFSLREQIATRESFRFQLEPSHLYPSHLYPSHLYPSHLYPLRAASQRGAGALGHNPIGYTGR